METSGQKVKLQLNEFVKLKLHDSLNAWTAKTVCTIIVPGLCSPVILGLPFLSHNHIAVDAKDHTSITKESGCDLLNPPRLHLE